MDIMKKYPSTVRDNVYEWTKDVKDVNILVGIPCYNNEDTIAHVVSTAAEGLRKYFPDMKSAVFISDGGSTDDTREKAYAAPVPDGFHRRVTIYRGMPGKGTSFRTVFELAMHLKADCCIVVDSDLRSITPEWIKLLAEPVLNKNAGFVAPYYIRHKNDGTITNNIIYPLTRALYGLKIRQPIGGDFGFSGEMAVLYTKEDVWDTDVAKFGIDIWMSTTAINTGLKIVQAQLGTKVHDAKDPAEHLGPMFRQVVSTLMYLMGKYEKRWRNVKGSAPVDLIGEPEKIAIINLILVLRRRRWDIFIRQTLLDQDTLEERTVLPDSIPFTLWMWQGILLLQASLLIHRLSLCVDISLRHGNLWAFPVYLRWITKWLPQEEGGIHTVSLRLFVSICL